MENIFKDVEKQMKEVEQGLVGFRGKAGSKDAEKLRKLLQISTVMNSTLQLEPLLGLVMDQVIEISKAEEGFLILVNQEGRLDFKVARNMGKGEIEDAQSEVSHTIIEEVIRKRSPLLVKDASQDEMFALKSSVQDLKLKSIMCVPLISKSQLIGLVYLENRSISGQFSQNDLNFLALFANQAAIAIENAGLYEDLIKSREKIEEWNRKLDQKVRERTEELRQLKEFNEKIVADAPIGIFTTDREGKVISANPALLEILGSPSEEKTKQFNVLELEPIKEAGLQKPFKRALLKGEKVELEELSYTSYWGKNAIVSLRLAPLRGRNGKPQGIVGIVEDCTQRSKLEKELKRRAQKLSLLNEVNKKISSSIKLDKVLRAIVEGAKELSAADSSCIQILDEGKADLIFTISAGESPQKAPGFNAAPEGMIDWILQNPRPLVISDTAQERRFPESRKKGIRAIVALPLMSKDKVIGLLRVNSQTPREFGQEELDLLSNFASQSAKAIENARLYEELETKVEDMERFNRLAVGRELKMVELKKRIKELTGEAGR